MSTAIVKGISFPFRFNNKGRVAVSKADDYEDTHIRESIKQILLTHVGERPMEPTFGSDVLDIVFQENDPSLDSIASNFAMKALEKWEKRIKVTNIEIVREYGKIYMRVSYQKNLNQELVSVTVELGGEN